VLLISKYFTGLAILNSCLGLFGLSAFTAQRLQKKPAFEKLLASIGSVIFPFLKDFPQFVLIAILIGFPLVWWGINDWLASFAYSIQMGADIFPLRRLYLRHHFNHDQFQIDQGSACQPGQQFSS
jgi:putative ABC transport system permease protein